MAGDHGEDPVILVTEETTADDIHGMAVAAGFLTTQRGATSHAAAVARGMRKCCVTGAKKTSSWTTNFGQQEAHTGRVLLQGARIQFGTQ